MSMKIGHSSSRSWGRSIFQGEKWYKCLTVSPERGLKSHALLPGSCIPFPATRYRQHSIFTSQVVERLLKWLNHSPRTGCSLCLPARWKCCSDRTPGTAKFDPTRATPPTATAPTNSANWAGNPWNSAEGIPSWTWPLGTRSRPPPRPTRSQRPHPTKHTIQSSLATHKWTSCSLNFRTEERVSCESREIADIPLFYGTHLLPLVFYLPSPGRGTKYWT